MAKLYTDLVILFDNTALPGTRNIMSEWLVIAICETFFTVEGLLGGRQYLGDTGVDSFVYALFASWFVGISLLLQG